jgi:hypothetical protein
LYVHFGGPPGFRRSNAYALLGKGVTTYIVSPTISGAASWPFGMPVENVHATFSFATLLAVISARPLNRRFS